MLSVSITVCSPTVNIAMIRRHFCHLLVLLLALSCAVASEEKENVEESEKKDEKTVSKRGAFHFSNHGHVHPALVSSSHYHLPPAIPSLLKYPVIHKPLLPVPVAPPIVAAAAPHYHIVPGGASVTSYSVNYPRFPVVQRPVVPILHKPVAVAPLPSFHVHNPHPSLHHHHHPDVHHHHSGFHFDQPSCHHHHSPSVHSHYPHSHLSHNFHSHYPSYAPHFHASPAVPSFFVAKPAVPVAFPAIRPAKYPVVFNQHKPAFSGFPQYVPVASPTPTFIPIAVPSNPQPVHPQPALPGQNTNFHPVTQEYPQISMPTQPTLAQRPTSSHGWRPIMMTQFHPQATRPTYTNKPPYNYHAPAVPFSHDQASSTNDIISGQGQVSAQLAQQLAHYQQHQQQQYIQHENSFPYPEAAETFNENYDAPSNDGRYQGLSSYQVPVHH